MAKKGTRAMANTHGESSMEEFAAKALPELEDLLERFKNPNKSEAPEPEPEPVNETDGLGDDAERIDELAHIIWHLASQIEDIAYHNEDISEKVISSMHAVKREMKYVNCFLRGDDDEPRF